jgi:hypothetical protein
MAHGFGLLTDIKKPDGRPKPSGLRRAKGRREKDDAG